MRVRPLQIGGVLAYAAILWSCATTGEQPFPTAPSLVGTTGGSGLTLATLEQGRKVYTTKCTECHVARSIKGYSAEQWRHYVSAMSPRAHLRSDEQAAVQSYLLAARAAAP